MRSGRRPDWETKVKSRFKEIEEWLKIGMTEKAICKNLGISQETWIQYKRKHVELSELIKKGRQEPVSMIKAALYKRALGFTYEEITITDSEKNGRTVQKFKKCALPDPTAALMLLKHWDKEIEWTSDPALLKLRRDELEFKKNQAEEEGWE